MKDQKPKILCLVGSASSNSSNHKLAARITELTKDDLEITIYRHLHKLPHFDTELSIENTPQPVLDLRAAISNADGLLICTPEYIFSIPSALKNALEWCVSTTVFPQKPVGFITASAHGKKGHEELTLILQTIEAKTTPEASLLIQGVKSKISPQGEITDSQTQQSITTFVQAYKKLLSA